MAKSRFSINIDDGGFQERVLDAMSKGRSSIERVGDDIALIIQSDVDERFDTAPGTETGGAVYGGKRWDKLDDSYLSANPRRKGGQLLRDTGELAQSFQVGGAGNVLVIGSNSVEFGSALEKAPKLHRKRPIIFAHPELIESVTKVWADFIVRNIVD